MVSPVKAEIKPRKYLAVPHHDGEGTKNTILTPPIVK
jgi:hypothetical protein